MDRSAFLTHLRSKMPANSAPVHPSRRTEARSLSPEQRLQLFVERATAALSHVYVCVSDEDVCKTLKEILADNSYVNTGVEQYSALLDTLENKALHRIEDDHLVTFGISEAWLGVALTGSCVLTSKQHRGGSLLPPRHIILLDASHIVVDLYAAYAGVADALKAERTSVFAFHTGPSRSADIEQTMALGVHGPGDVHIIVVAK